MEAGEDQDDDADVVLSDDTDSATSSHEKAARVRRRKVLYVVVACFFLFFRLRVFRFVQKLPEDQLTMEHFSPKKQPGLGRRYDIHTLSCSLHFLIIIFFHCHSHTHTYSRKTKIITESFADEQGFFGEDYYYVC